VKGRNFSEIKNSDKWLLCVCVFGGGGSNAQFSFKMWSFFFNSSVLFQQV
jgi:hypothetical protein